MDLLQELNEAITAKNKAVIKSALTKIINETITFELKGPSAFVALLSMQDPEIIELTFQCIAELAKEDQNRKAFTDEVLIMHLIKKCSTLNSTNIFHFVRALGNITYENDQARSIIGVEGLKSVFEELKEIVLAWTPTDDLALLTAIFGCLLNIIMGEDELQKCLYQADVLTVSEKVLQFISGQFLKYEDCISYIVHIISYVTDHMVDEWITTNLCVLLVNILKVSENPEISVLCLGILRQQSENDDLKTCLAINGTCELIYNLVERYGNEVNDEESRAALKIACDLIVLILTGDEAMNLLYDNGNGIVYEQMITWMDSSDPDLVSTAVLAIGNFARSDAHCISMVEGELFRKLIALLAKNNKKDADIKIQHALLSTLRHLSIPPQNKFKLIQENIIEIMYEMIDIETSPVVFKLMGTFRMLVNGQESTARLLINRKPFLEKIGYWCYNSDHVGVRAEAPRLLVWLIKNCNSVDAFPMILTLPNCIRCLTDMLCALHGVMQNEALLALNVLCEFCLLSKPNVEVVDPMAKGSDKSLNYFSHGQTFNMFVKADLGKNLVFMIEKYHEKLTVDIINGVLSLIDTLSKSTEMNRYLKSCSIEKALPLLLVNGELDKVKHKVDDLTKAFQK
nr:rap1 GTPase-GDP dissociation stimulator 1-B-like [Onthophagus taurus]